MDRLECDIVNKDSVITQQKMRIQELEMMVERSRGDLLQKELDLQLSMKAVADSMDLSESTTDKCDKLQALCEELHLKCEKQQTKYENLENQIADKEMDYQARIEELERQMVIFIKISLDLHNGGALLPNFIYQPSRNKNPPR